MLKKAAWITGPTTRVTTTENVLVAVLPDESAVEHVTVVVPIGKVDPDEGAHVTLGFVPELSWAAGVV